MFVINSEVIRLLEQGCGEEALQQICQCGECGAQRSSKGMAGMKAISNTRQGSNADMALGKNKHMRSLLCLLPALMYTTKFKLRSNGCHWRASRARALFISNMAKTQRPTYSPELICPQFGRCSQVKGQGWTRSCQATVLGQGLAPGNPWLLVVLTVNNIFVPALQIVPKKRPLYLNR